MNDLETSWLALGEPNRLHLFRLLLDRPLCVSDLTSVTGFRQSLVSHHLAVLVRAGWLAARREGRRTYYAPAVTGTPLAPLARWVRRRISLPAGWNWPAAAGLPERSGPGGAGAELEDFLL